MGDIALVGWGIAVGSWITSLWVMRKPPEMSVPDEIVAECLLQIKSARRWAPDMQLKASDGFCFQGERYRLTVSPEINTTTRKDPRNDEG